MAVESIELDGSVICAFCPVRVTSTRGCAVLRGRMSRVGNTLAPMIEAWIEHAPGHNEWYVGARGAVPAGMTARLLQGRWEKPEQAVAASEVGAILAEWGNRRIGDAWRDEVGRWWIPVEPVTT